MLPPVAPKMAAPRRGRWLWRILGLLLLLGLMGVGYEAVLMLTPGPLKEDKTIVIPRGTSVQGIAALLDSNGVVHDSIAFRLAARGLAEDKLHAGEYQFTPQQNMLDMVLMLRDGRSVVRRFTVAEGLTAHEIVEMLRDEPTLTGEIKTPPPEGSLMPETYHYSYGDSRQGILDRMQKGQRALLEALWAARASDLPLKTPEEALVLASIVEKETGKKAEERARVAGVFVNRLKRGMPLQADPTVVYALTKGDGPLERDLKHDDLAVASPYNTYVNTGLPPAPICNPGRAALEAALRPEKHDYLYFVADGTGGHAFAKNLAEHNQNVARWLTLLRP